MGACRGKRVGCLWGACCFPSMSRCSWFLPTMGLQHRAWCHSMAFPWIFSAPHAGSRTHGLISLGPWRFLTRHKCLSRPRLLLFLQLTCTWEKLPDWLNQPCKCEDLLNNIAVLLEQTCIHSCESYGRGMHLNFRALVLPLWCLCCTPACSLTEADTRPEKTIPHQGSNFPDEQWCVLWEPPSQHTEWEGSL